MTVDKKLMVFVIGGSGMSSEGARYLLKNVVKETLDGVVDAEIHEFTPFFFRRKCRKMRRLMDEDDKNTGVLFVAKSLGAYRFIEHFTSDLYHSIKCNYHYQRCSVATIDPHAPFGLCNSNNNLELPNKMWAPIFQTWNVYQIAKFPRIIDGARIIGAHNILVDTDHKGIVRSAGAIETIREAALWAVGGRL